MCVTLSPTLLLGIGMLGCGSVSSDGIKTTDAHADPDASHVVHEDDAGGGPHHIDASTVDANDVDADDDDARPAGDARAIDARTTDAQDAAPLNFGEASTTYPAATADVPTVQNQGGPVLTAPHIVTVTWPDEGNAAALEAFGDDIGPSSYWAATTREYGVGPAYSGPASHVRLTEQPIGQWSDTDLDAWVADHLANYATYGFPAPDSQTLYVFYLSTSTDLTVEGTDGCQQGIGGYHISLSGSDYPYAVILQCGGDDLRQATSSASHELIEAVTDPHPNDIAAYYGFDAAHLAWDVFQEFQDEVADACEFYYGPNGAFYNQTFNIIEWATRGDAGADAGDAGDAGLVPDAGTTTFNVQRTWSNVSAAAGHNPCVPTVAGPYYAVTPLDQSTVTMNLTQLGGGANAQGLGYSIKKGQTKTFPVAFHSDEATSGPWTISVSEGNPLLGGSQGSHVTMTIDHPTGVNGDIAYITVTVNAIDTTMNGELITVVSQLQGFGRTYVPILISND